MKVFPSGDRAILIKFGDYIDEMLNLKIKHFVSNILAQNFPWVEEVVPSFTDVMVVYSCEHIRYFEAKRIIMSYFEVEERMTKIETRVVKIPVLYGEDYGIDIVDVASMNSLSVSEVIKIHTESKYLVYMLGFTPGFPYLGGLDQRLHTPRLKTPRKVIKAGSVAIGGEQTGVYPIDSPGGWRIIGRTPLRLFDMDNEQPALLRQGDYIQFFEIDSDEFLEITSMVEEGTYIVESEPLII